MMRQGCVSESSHICIVFLVSENQTFIISASHHVVHQDLNRNLSLVIERIPNKANLLSTTYSSRLGLCPSSGAAILQENFTSKTNTAKIAKLVLS